jgi:molecular chaperone IbpA
MFNTTEITTIGSADFLSKMLETPFLNMSPNTNGRNFPPYNILRFKDGSCRLDLAVAGYTRDRLSVDVESSTLIIKGQPETRMEADCVEVTKSGIANTAWTRTFDLDPNAKIDNVELKDGILHVAVSLKEVKKPRTSFTIK